MSTGTYKERLEQNNSILEQNNIEINQAIDMTKSLKNISEIYSIPIEGMAAVKIEGLPENITFNDVSYIKGVNNRLIASDTDNIYCFTITDDVVDAEYKTYTKTELGVNSITKVIASVPGVNDDNNLCVIYYHGIHTGSTYCIGACVYNIETNTIELEAYSNIIQDLSLYSIIVAANKSPYVIATLSSSSVFVYKADFSKNSITQIFYQYINSSSMQGIAFSQNDLYLGAYGNGWYSANYYTDLGIIALNAEYNKVAYSSASATGSITYNSGAIDDVNGIVQQYSTNYYGYFGTHYLSTIDATINIGSELTVVGTTPSLSARRTFALSDGSMIVYGKDNSVRTLYRITFNTEDNTFKYDALPVEATLNVADIRMSEGNGQLNFIGLNNGKISLVAYKYDLVDVVGLVYNKETFLKTESTLTAKPADVLVDKTFLGGSGIKKGTMPNNGELNYTPTTEEQTIPAGYTSGGIIEAVPIDKVGYDNCIVLVNDILHVEPLPYIELDYIQGNGTQWIDTGVKPSNTIKMQLKAIPTSSLGNIFLGENSVSDSQDYRLFFTGGQMYFDRGSSRYSASKPINTMYELEIGDYYVKDLVTGSNIFTGSSMTFDYSSHSAIGLFNCASVSSASESGKIYYLKIYNNDILVRDFIPVKEKETDIICLYDKVSEEFYYNAGSGEFIAGPEKEV